MKGVIAMSRNVVRVCPFLLYTRDMYDQAIPKQFCACIEEDCKFWSSNTFPGEGTVQGCSIRLLSQSLHNLCFHVSQLTR